MSRSTRSSSGCAYVPTKIRKTMKKTGDVKKQQPPRIDHLELTTENVTKTLNKWAGHAAHLFYPDMGSQTYRVPAFCFHHQNLLTPEQAAKKSLVSLPDSSSSLSAPSSPSVLSSSSFLSLSESSHGENVLMVDDKSCVEPVQNDPSGGVFLPHIPENTTLDRLTPVLSKKGCEDPQKHQVLEDRKGFQEVEATDENGISEVGFSCSYLSRIPVPKCESVEFRDDACSQPVARDSLVNNSKRENKRHSPEVHVQDVSGFEPVCNSKDTDQQKHSESAVSPTSPRNKTKRRRRSKAKCSEKSNNKQLTNSEDNGHHKEQNAYDYQELASRSSEHEIPGSTELSKNRLAVPSLLDNWKTEKQSSTARHTDVPDSSKNAQMEFSSSEPISKTRNTQQPEEVSKQEVLSSKPSGKNKEAQQPVLLVCPPQESMMRRDRAVTIVLDSFEILGKELEAEGGKGLFIISGVNYDNYLNRIPPQILNGYDGGHLGSSRTSRGVLDILILQEHVGIMLVQVKSVGGNKAEWQASDNEMVAALESVIQKVRAKSLKLREDLGRELNLGPDAREQMADSHKVFHMLALPFIPRQLYNKMRENEAYAYDYFELKVLCKEDFEDLANVGRATEMHRESTATSTHIPHHATGVCSVPTSPKSSLYMWWRSVFLHTESRLSLEKIQKIVGKICGIFSSVTVLPDTKCRHEVRTYGHCISETATRYSAPCLTIPQYNLLQCQDPFVALSGPPGSGKSLLLMLKAVEWLEQGEHGEDHVVVASIGRTAVTQPRARVLREAIKARSAGNGVQGDLLRVIYALDKISVQNIEHEIAASISSLVKHARETRPTIDGTSDEMSDMREENMDGNTDKNREVERFRFVVSDVDFNDKKTQLVLQALCMHPLVQSVWWSTSEPLGIQGTWSLYRVEELRTVIRRPPHVQRVLKGLEWRDQWKSLYATSSDESGLPTDGPPIIWIHHQDHLQEIRQTVCSVQKFMERSLPNPHQRQNQQQRNEGLQHSTHCGPVLNQKESSDLELVHQDVDQTQDYTEYHISTSHGGRPILNHNSSHDQEQDPADRFQDPVFGEGQNVCSLGEKGHPKLCRQDSDSCPSLLDVTDFNGDFHSPFWCDFCAERVAEIISDLLGDSSCPKLFPFFAGSAKLMKDPSKNKFGMAIKPRDILILTTFPHLRNSIENSGQEDIKRYTRELAQSTFVLKIQDQVPLRVLTEESGSKIAFPRNSAVLTDTSTARGLERKVVIYIPFSQEKACCRVNVTEPGGGLPTNLPYFTSGTRFCKINCDVPVRGNTDPSEFNTSETMDLSTESFLTEIEESNKEPMAANTQTNDWHSITEGIDDRTVLSSVYDTTKTNCVTRKSGRTVTDHLTSTKISGNTNWDRWSFDKDLPTSFTALDEETPLSGVSSNKTELGPAEELFSETMDSFRVSDDSDTEEDSLLRVEISSSSSSSDLSWHSCADTLSEPSSEEFGMDNSAHTNQDNVPRSVLSDVEPEHNEKVSSYIKDADNKVQRQEEQEGAPSDEEKQLPSWIESNKRVNRFNSPKLEILKNVVERYVGQKIDLTEVLGEEAVRCAQAVQNTKNKVAQNQDIREQISKLDDDNKRGLYTAASCCLAQLVVVMP